MTGTPGPGAPARDGSAGSASLRSAVGAIGVMLAVGLAFRLIMAYLYPPLAGSGFDNDLASFRGWADDLATNGPAGFYTRPGFHDYTPGYLYALWAVGVVGKAIGGIGDLIKLPAIVSDVALAFVVFLMLRDLGVRESRARIGALIVLINPITWFDSVVWGQVDSVGVVFMLLGGPRAVERPPRAGRDPDGRRRAHQATAGHPHPDRGVGDGPAGAVAAGRLRR